MSRHLRELACAAALLVAAGCGAAPTMAAAEHTFVAQMIPHHELGMTLMDIAATRADDVRLRRLVFEMGGYHHSEMASLSRWSFEWSITPADEFPGSLTDSTLDRLADMSGPEFDAAWLEAMIVHHEGALAISRSSLAQGMRSEMEKMANATVVVQSREIDEMRRLMKDPAVGN